MAEERSTSLVAPPPSLKGSKDRDDDTGSIGSNTPDIDAETGDIGRRAITSADQAHRICEAMFNPQNERNMMNGTIALKYADSPPFDDAKLKRDKEDWRHNFATGFLSSFVNRIVPAPMAVIDSAKYLTAAKLDVEDDPDGSLTEVFQRETTKLFRSWNEWRSTCYAIAQEDVLFGYTAAAAVDPDEWRVQFLRQDEFGVPDGSGQHPALVPMFGIKKSFLMHELYELIENRKAAESAGWEYENTVDAINEAMPKQALRSPNDTREQADLMREAGNAGTSHEADAKVIEVYRLFSVEIDGKVTQHVVRRTGDPKSLFHCEDQFESIEDVLTLFTLEEGNSKFYGSKGIGRKIINEHIAVERARNRLCDHAYLSSMIWIVGSNGLPTVQFKVRHPIGMIGTDADFKPEIIPTDVKGFLELDERLTAFAEAAVGSYLVEKQGENANPHQTATEATIRAQKEQQQSVAFLQRFFGQMANMISMMTRRACNPDTRDEEAKEYQERMIKGGLTKDLIAKLAEMPAVEVIHDLAQTQNESIIALCEELKGSPFADQKKVWQRLATARTNSRIADELILKDQFDPTEEGEQARLQILEIAAIRTGESVMVVRSDLDPVHLKVLVGDMTSSTPGVLQKVQQGSPEVPQLLDNINAGMRHGEAHLMQWEAKSKASKNQDDLAQIEKYREFFDQGEQALTGAAKQYQQILAQRASGGDQSVPAGQAGPALPPGAPQQMGTQPPPDAQPPGPGAPAGFGDHLGKISTTISYKDAPPSIKRQIEFHAGFTPAFGANESNQFQPQWDENPVTGFPMAPGSQDGAIPGKEQPPNSGLTPPPPAVT